MMSEKLVQIGDFSYFPARVLGKGSTGMVFQGHRNKDQHPVAVKAIRLDELDTAFKKHLLECEVKALQSVKHKNVCVTYEIMKDGEYYFVVMEHCQNGTLRDHIKSRGPLSEREALSIFGNIIEGYRQIKQCGFLHRDLKTENVLLRANMEPVIIDFGYCELASTQYRSIPYSVGSLAYMSPEAFRDNYYSDKSDIWALGIVLHQMLTGTIPLIRQSNIADYFQNLRRQFTPEITYNGTHEVCMKVLRGCLTVDINKRFSLEDICAAISGPNPPSLRRINSMGSGLNLEFALSDQKMSQKYHESTNYRLSSPQHSARFIPLKSAGNIPPAGLPSPRSPQTSPYAPKSMKRLDLQQSANLLEMYSERVIMPPVPCHFEERRKQAISMKIV